MTAQSQKPAGELYVHRIDELRQEIRHAMAAITGNKLQAFEESLWRQEVLCTGLKHLLGTVAPSALGNTLDTRLKTSLAALHELNQTYADLLRQAQSSNHLFSTLCQAYRQHRGERTDSQGRRCSLEV